MLSLLSLLQSRRDWPGGVLAERLEVTTRTVRRDVDRLRELGYRIEAAKGPDGGYRLAAGSDLPPLLFDDEQAVAITLALQTAATSGVDIAEPAERALATVRQVMPARLRHRIDGITFASAEVADRVDPAVLEAASEAVRSQMVLRFAYGESDEPRRVEPHGLVARNARWYLVAWDLDRDDWRLFRLDRLRPKVPTGPRFAMRVIPTGRPETFVAARTKGSHDVNAWPCEGTIEISLPANEVMPWLRDGRLASTTDTSCVVVMGSWSWTGLLASVLRFDVPFRIVEPADLAHAAAELAERLATSHS